MECFKCKNGVFLQGKAKKEDLLRGLRCLNYMTLKKIILCVLLGLLFFKFSFPVFYMWFKFFELGLAFYYYDFFLLKNSKYRLIRVISISFSWLVLVLV